LAFLGAIALALLTLVGYSSGVTLASRKRPFLPTILDLLLVTFLWIAVFWFQDRIDNRWLILSIGLFAGILVGYVATALRVINTDYTVEIPKSELPEHAREKLAVGAESNAFKQFWHRWNAFASIMGNVQVRIIMGFFYFIVVTPGGLVMRVFSDPLEIKKQPAISNWTSKEATDTSIEAAKEQG
jgi:hypothetical protein